MNEPVESMEMAETKELVSEDETEWMYAEDTAPGTKNLREYVRDGVGGLT